VFCLRTSAANPRHYLCWQLFLKFVKNSKATIRNKTMRITLAILLACKVGNKFEEIGKFQADVGVTKMEFISYRNLEKTVAG